ARRSVMSKNQRFVLGLTVFAALQTACGGLEPDAESSGADEAITQVYEGKLTVAQAQSSCNCRLQVVSVGGTVFHFGLDLAQSPPVPYPFQATVAGARVSIAEVSATRLLN